MPNKVVVITSLANGRRGEKERERRRVTEQHTRYHHEMFGTNANIFGVPVPLKITADRPPPRAHMRTPPLLFRPLPYIATSFLLRLLLLRDEMQLPRISSSSATTLPTTH